MLFVLALASAFAHDPRRTGQLDLVGPATADGVSSVVLEEESAVNCPPVVTEDGGVLVGTWGVVRSFGSEDEREWDKADGHLFRFDREMELEWEHAPDFVPYCYEYGGRTNPVCTHGGEWNAYNGTVEGIPAVVDGIAYFGRGDGKLYAVDVATGERVWTFTTFNPEDTLDPEGGGEVVSGPLVGPDGTIYFGTMAVGDWETNAIYAVNSDGSLRWRYPSEDRGLDNIVWAPPSLSPDGSRIYVPVAFGPRAEAFDPEIPGRVHAFEADGTLAWTFEPVNEDEWWQPTVWVNHVAVGADGRIYIGGSEYTLGGGSAVVTAIEDRGDHAALAWPGWVDVDYNEAAYVGGLALREAAGETLGVYVSSGRLYLLGYPDGGVLMHLDPTDGSERWTFDPEAVGLHGAVSGIVLDVEGNAYSGVSGTPATGNHGTVFSLDPEGTLRWQFDLEGLLEWAHPVLGPQGDLYVADTTRCAQLAWPIETNNCQETVGDPRLYRLPGPDAEGDADTDTDTDTDADSGTDIDTDSGEGNGRPPSDGCGCASGTGGTAVPSLLLLAGLIGRSPRSSSRC